MLGRLETQLTRLRTGAVFMLCPVGYSLKGKQENGRHGIVLQGCDTFRSAGDEVRSELASMSSGQCRSRNRTR